MKLNLDKEEKLALLQAASVGVLDTRKIPRIYKEIQGHNPFLELMMETEDEEETTGENSNTSV